MYLARVCVAAQHAPSHYRLHSANTCQSYDLPFGRPFRAHAAPGRMHIKTEVARDQRLKPTPLSVAPTTDAQLEGTEGLPCENHAPYDNLNTKTHAQTRTTTTRSHAHMHTHKQGKDHSRGNTPSGDFERRYRARRAGRKNSNEISDR